MLAKLKQHKTATSSLLVAIAAIAFALLGCNKTAWPEPECVIDTSPAVGGNYAHVCRCNPAGVEFVYKRVKGPDGTTVGWETRERCNGKEIPRVMFSDEFPAWTGPPPPLDPTSSSSPDGAAAPKPPATPHVDETVEELPKPEPAAEPPSVDAERPDRPGTDNGTDNGTAGDNTEPGEV